MFNTLRTCLHILSVVVLCLSQSPSALAGAQIDETVTYYHCDHLGSIIAASDEAGKLLWQEDYAPYGARLTRENDDRNTLWFTGKPHEDALGLSYFNARWYNPRTARFTGVDPVGVSPENPHSFNRYAYANNNPFKYVDPDGESPLDVVFLIADTVKLGFAVYNGVGIGNAAADLAASAVGLASPLPGVGQAIKAARLSSKASKVAAKSSGKSLVPYYPPNRGFLGQSQKTVLQPGTKVDRYGYDGGTFVAPQGTPTQMRALPPGSAQKPYSGFEVQKPITVDGGTTAPAFSRIGLGTQYELPGSVSSFLKSGALKRIGK